MGVSPNFDFLWFFTVEMIFLPKTKMLRTVHTNNFYGMGLEISGGKSELGTKSKK